MVCGWWFGVRVGAVVLVWRGMGFNEKKCVLFSNNSILQS